MILVSALTASCFLVVGFPRLVLPDGIFLALRQNVAILFLFLWFRATFPRYRYDPVDAVGLEGLFRSV